MRVLRCDAMRRGPLYRGAKSYAYMGGRAFVHVDLGMPIG